MTATETTATTRRAFLSLDAGEMREQLAADLVDWIDAEMVSPSTANTFHRRTKILACRTRRTKAETLTDIKADADNLIAERAWEAATEAGNR